MAVDLCSDPSSGISPRISFSNDFCLPEFGPLDQQPQKPSFRSASPGSSVDFDFCVRKSSFDHDSSSADELFSDGKILPTQIKTRTPKLPPATPTPTPTTPPTPYDDDRTDAGESSNKREEDHVPHQNCKDGNCNSSIGGEEEAKQQQSSSNSKSFWRFKRSSSVNCATGYGRTLCPLPLLSRSNSTGSSTASVKLSRDGGKQQQQHHKQPPSTAATRLSSSSSSATDHKKPPLRKGGSGGGYGNGGAGVRVSPVINVPSGNMFGLGSIFFSNNNKEKSNKSKK